MKAALLRNTLLIAVLVTGALYLLRDRVAFDFPLVLGANIFLAVVTLLSGFVSSRGNPQRTASFVNGIYGGTLLRLFLIAGAAAVYIVMSKGQVDTRSLLMAALLYIIYTGAETFVLQKATRKGATQTEK